MFLNTVCFEGRTGKDPVSQKTTLGKSVTRSSIALYQGKDKPALWLQLTGWDKMAEVLAETKKGDSIVVTGDLYQSTYSGQDGKERTDLGVNVRGFSWGSKPAQNDPSRATSSPPADDAWGAPGW